MKRDLLFHRCKYGLAFFLGDKLIHYIHENDGDVSQEYHGPLFKKLGYNLVSLGNLNVEQVAQVRVWEQ